MLNGRLLRQKIHVERHVIRNGDLIMSMAEIAGCEDGDVFFLWIRGKP